MALIQEKEEPQARPATYSYMDLIQFEPENLWGSFGKQTISKRRTEPKFGFGTSTRNQQENIYLSKEMAKTMFIGKTSPGPNYDVTDEFTYDKDPEWKFGTDPRNTLNTGPKFDHYLRQDVDFDPLVADQSRRQKNLIVRIGLESRFPNDPKRYKGTPGPHYNPSLRHEIPNSTKYTFGFRRNIQGQAPLQPYVSTPDVVGPGLYMRQQVPNVSTQNKKPLYSMPKSLRQGLENRTFDKYQTYDYKQKAIGLQVNSKKRTMPSISIGKGQRATPAGIYKQHMTCPQSSIRIPHPKF